MGRVEVARLLKQAKGPANHFSTPSNRGQRVDHGSYGGGNMQSGRENVCFKCGMPGHFASRAFYSMDGIYDRANPFSGCPSVGGNQQDSYSGGGAQKRRLPSTMTDNSGAKKARRCSVCHQTGHTKNKCPQLTGTWHQG